MNFWECVCVFVNLVCDVVWQNYVCDQVVCVSKIVCDKLASHLTQPEHIAHCLVLASSRTPGQRGDKRHHVGLSGAAQTNTWNEPELTQQANVIAAGPWEPPGKAR